MTKKTKKLFWTIFFVLLLGAAGTYAYFTWFAPATETAAAAETLQTARVRQGDLILYASGTGTLIPAAEATFGFETSGQVTEILVKVGDEVEAGQVLALLDDTDALSSLASARRDLLELTSPLAVATARQQIAQAEDALDSARDTLAWQISPSVLTWEERVAEAEAALQKAKDENASAETIAAAEQTLKQAQASLAYARNSYQAYLEEYFVETETIMTRGGPQTVNVRDEEGNLVINAPTELQIATARADYDLAGASLQEAQWYLSALLGEEIPEDATGASLVKLENAQAAYDKAQENLDATQLTAPISGTLMSFDVNVGDLVGTSAFATIADLSTPYLEIYLDETDWDKIAVDYPVEVIFDALPDKIYTGVVTQVDPGLVSQQGTSLVHGYVKLDPSQGGLNLPTGMSAAVDVIGGRAEGAILVPVEALREISPGEYAVFVVENGEPVMRMVEVGLKDLLYAEIISGLQAGEVVSTGIVETGQ
ncbi:MAG: efflux RND transporter periplasmic adaptor subunit [Chloroflexota bacterium]